jgi:hypothetical protein
MTITPDLQFSNCGSFATMTPMTEAGENWVADNICDDALCIFGTISIDFRCLEDIVLGARADGLICEG